MDLWKPNKMTGTSKGLPGCRWSLEAKDCGCWGKAMGSREREHGAQSRNSTAQSRNSTAQSREEKQRAGECQVSDSAGTRGQRQGPADILLTARPLPEGSQLGEWGGGRGAAHAKIYMRRSIWIFLQMGFHGRCQLHNVFYKNGMKGRLDCER